MRKLIIILFLLPVMAQCQKRLGWAKTPKLNVYGKDVYFFTNSIGLGTYANVNYPEIFCNARGAIKHNLGINGQTMINSCGFAVFNKTTIPTYTDGMVMVVELGLNDIGFNNGTTAEQFETKYIEVLDYAIETKGWPPSRISMLTPHKPIDYTAYGTDEDCNPSYADDTGSEEFCDVIRSLAVEYGAKLIDVKVLSASWVSGDFYSDKLHLSDAGQTKLANILIERL